MEQTEAKQSKFMEIDELVGELITLWSGTVSINAVCATRV